jgi:hypothetical protein
MKAIIAMLQINMLEGDACTFFKIGGLDSNERYTFVFTFLHDAKNEIGVFQTNRLSKIDRKERERNG